jgi:hypothetical protein
MLRRISDKVKSIASDSSVTRTAKAVARLESRSEEAPIVFFNASARLGFLSQNAAFSLLSAWGLRLGGHRVVHFVCDHGMSRCVLGTNPGDATQPPPCAVCVARSQLLYQDAQVRWFQYRDEPELAAQVAKLSVEELQRVNYNDWPLGEVVLPALRWALRRHNLADNDATRLLYREYILSAYNVGREWERALDELQPRVVVLFNGVMYPEAMARRLARERGIRTIAHEVGLRPFTAFFTEGEATAYPMDIPADFQLNDAQNRELDDYLSQRFEGKFSMAGIQFWPQMQELDADFLAKAAQFEKIVPVFTNVIFDTSQVHANTLFEHMFAWLDELLTLIRENPQTLFIIRAHPDEMRPGTRKQSRESVSAWVNEHGVDKLPNVAFVGPDEYLSSYALIQRSHVVLVYNSSIGLEASIMGKPVLAAGAGRYTHFPTVYYPSSAEEYLRAAETFLKQEQVEQPAAFVAEARRVLYFQLFRTGLPFGEYLEAHSRKGLVHVRSFPAESLMPGESPAIRAIEAGIEGKPFLV